MKKILKYIFINLFIFCTFFGILEYVIYKNSYNQNKFYCDMGYCKYRYNFRNVPFWPACFNDYGRKSVIHKKYKKSPVVLFGCSYAYGYHLEDNQTFAYKLEKILNRPVINRAVVSGSLQSMLYQSESEELYELIPEAKDVIYIMIGDQTRRLFLDTIQVAEHFNKIIYRKKNNNLVMLNYKNPFLNFIRSSYIYRLIKKNYINKYLNDEKNADEITDLELLYFVKSRENLEKHWNTKVNFTIIIYIRTLYDELLEKKLKENGFNVMNTKNLTSADLESEKYMMFNFHPKETAWDLLTPIIVSKLYINTSSK